MDGSRFDALTRRVTTRLTRRTNLGLLAGASLPLLGLSESADAKKKKITLCFNGQTVKKPKKQARKLQKKGATKGACDPRLCGNGGPCTVFLTSSSFTGSEIGGLAGGDAKCATLASGAGLFGTFKAWLSAGAQTPGTRFDNVNRGGPYRLIANSGDGGNPPPLVATNFADLLSCDTTCLQSGIDRDEDGQVRAINPGAWTGTLANGNASADTCSGWTSTAGNGLFGNRADNTTLWTENSSGPCTFAFPIYCFQQAI